MQEPYLTIAIPTMKRWSFLKNMLPLYLARPEVGEVIICDETGDDINEIARSSFRSHPKLRLFTNDYVLGIYENKIKCVGLAMYKWIALLDSDNYFLDEWFYRLSEVLDLKNPNMIYASASFLFTNMDTGAVSRPCAAFVNTRISKTNWNTILRTSGWNFLLNDGNWVFSKEASECLNKYKSSKILLAADAIYMLRELIINGYEIWYVPGLDYVHNVHSGSSWLLTEQKSTQILAKTRWDI